MKTYKVTFEISVSLEALKENKHLNGQGITPSKIQDAIVNVLPSGYDVTRPYISSPTFTIAELEQLGEIPTI